MTSKEEIVASALRRLTPFLMKKLNAQEVGMYLYGREQLTFFEYEELRTETDTVKANKNLLRALERRGEDILDELLDVLKIEAVSNKAIIGEIEKVYTERKKEGATASVPGIPPEVSESVRDKLFGHGEWPEPNAFEPGPPTHDIPDENTDYDPRMAYKMESNPRGMAMIINNRNFTCGMKERIGTDKDAKNLKELFANLGFFTNRFNDLTGKEMHKKTRELARKDHTKYDCLIVAILTHGVKGRLYSTDGDLIPVEDLTSYFDGLNCPSLIGKPKIFIIQACRGPEFDYGVEVEATDSAEMVDVAKQRETMEQQFDKVIEKALDDKEDFFVDDEEEEMEKKEEEGKAAVESTDGRGAMKTLVLPVKADMLIAYATVPGFVSWRNSEYGSWFIKALVDTVRELANTEHFMDILTVVNGRVAKEFQSKGRSKQMPEPVTRLTRKLYLRPIVTMK